MRNARVTLKSNILYIKDQHRTQKLSIADIDEGSLHFLKSSVGFKFTFHNYETNQESRTVTFRLLNNNDDMKSQFGDMKGKFDMKSQFDSEIPEEIYNDASEKQIVISWIESLRRLKQGHVSFPLIMWEHLVLQKTHV